MEISPSFSCVCSVTRAKRKMLHFPSSMMYPISGIPFFLLQHVPSQLDSSEHFSPLFLLRSKPERWWNVSRKLRVEDVNESHNGWEMYKVIMFQKWNSGFPLVSLVLWPETPSSPCATRCLDRWFTIKEWRTCCEYEWDFPSSLRSLFGWMFGEQKWNVLP